MKPVDYGEISNIYDDVREADVTLVNYMLQRLPSRKGLRVLDVGCGTGNYTDLLQKVTEQGDWHICGVDPSDGMLDKACQKNTRIDFRHGTGARIPWEDGSFDFVYMTDVIHHVPDIAAMFSEIRRVLTSGGIACVATQSHDQIEARPIARFFPRTVIIDKERYPDIGTIVAAAQHSGLQPAGQDVLSAGQEIVLGMEYLELVRKKGYSMLCLLAESDYQQGLRALEGALQDGPIVARSAGDTLVWFIKP